MPAFESLSFKEILVGRYYDRKQICLQLLQADNDLRDNEKQGGEKSEKEFQLNLYLF